MICIFENIFLDIVFSNGINFMIFDFLWKSNVLLNVTRGGFKKKTCILFIQFIP